MRPEHPINYGQYFCVPKAQVWQPISLGTLDPYHNSRCSFKQGCTNKGPRRAFFGPFQLTKLAYFTYTKDVFLWKKQSKQNFGLCWLNKKPSGGYIWHAARMFVHAWAKRISMKNKVRVFGYYCITFDSELWHLNWAKSSLLMENLGFVSCRKSFCRQNENFSELSDDVTRIFWREWPDNGLWYTSQTSSIMKKFKISFFKNEFLKILI